MIALNIPVFAEDVAGAAAEGEYTVGTFTGRLRMGPYVSGYVSNDHDLYVWGDNTYGQFGNGNTESSNIPVKVLEGVDQVCFGSSHTAALKSDGTLWTWGTNTNGELGQGDTEDHFTPVKVLDDVVSFNAKGSNTGAVTSDGSLYVWGDNFYGQVGNGSTDDVLVPVKVLDNVRQVNLGYYHTGAVKTNGDCYVWGDNEFGQVGNGTTTDVLTPTKIIDNVNQIALGMDHTGVIRTDGTYWAWGENQLGQLGDGTTEDKYEPEQILEEVTLLRYGYNHSAVIRVDGSLWTWGLNNYGQLGDGTTETRNAPVRVLSDIALVNLGHYHTGVITTDGTCYTWGDNTYGQLGNGTNETSLTPVEVFTGSVPWGVSSISVVPESTVLTTAAGGINSEILNAEIFDGTGDEVVRWSVDPAGVVDITPNGNSVTVTAKSEGTATVVAAYRGIYSTAKVEVNDAPVMGEVNISATNPDTFAVNAYNLQANPAFNDNSGEIHSVTMYVWSDDGQRDLITKEVTKGERGTYSGIFTINKNEMGGHLLNANNIKVDVYASNTPGSAGTKIASTSYDWTRSKEARNHSLVYTGYSQNLGFNENALYEKGTAGTTGQALHLEGLRVSSVVNGVDVNVATHLQNVGWTSPVGDGVYAGTMGENRPIECVVLTLTGDNADLYTIRYRAHVRDLGWLDWVEGGQEAGTTGQARPIEALEIELVRK